MHRTALFVACFSVAAGTASAETIDLLVMDTRARQVIPVRQAMCSNAGGQDVEYEDASGKFVVLGSSTRTPYDPNAFGQSSYQLEFLNVETGRIEEDKNTEVGFKHIVGHPPIGGDEFRYAASPCTYIIRGVVTIQWTEDELIGVGGIVGPDDPLDKAAYEAVKENSGYHVGYWGRDEHGEYEIIGVTRTSAPPSSLDPRPPTVLRFSKRYSVHVFNEVCTHVAAGEAMDQALLILPVSERVEFSSEAMTRYAIKGTFKRVSREVLEKMVLSDILNQRMAWGGAVIIAQCIYNGDTLFSADTGVDLLTAGLAKLLLPGGGAGVLIGITLSVAPALIVGHIEQSTLEMFACSDDLEISSAHDAPGSAYRFMVKNLGQKIQDVQIRTEGGYDAAVSVQLPSLERGESGDLSCGVRAGAKYILHYVTEYYPGLRVSCRKELPVPSQETGKGKLDVVFCIDISGSMADDIDAVKSKVDETLARFNERAAKDDISLQLGLVTYTRHEDPDWLQATALTTNTQAIRDAIQGIQIVNLGLGGGGNEDTYGALMYAMNQPVGGRQFQMGWRGGEGGKGAAALSQNPASTGTPVDIGDRMAAAKIIITMGDEPQDDPDSFGHTLDKVAQVARDLDPVHIYPIVLPKEGNAILDRAVAAKKRIAEATGGELIQINKAAELPDALVATLQIAIRRHKEEIWRQAHPPYLLYGVGGGIGLIVVIALAVLLIRGLARPRRTPALVTRPLDTRLAGGAAETHDPRQTPGV